MEQYDLIGEPTFTANKVSTMEKYRFFSSNQTGTLNSFPPQEIFRIWVTRLKYSTHRWQVKQVVRRSLRTPCDIELDLE